LLRYHLLRYHEEGRQIARRGRALVRERSLLTRSIAVEPELVGDLLGTPQPRSAVTKTGLAGEERHPVCGMQLDPEEAPDYEHAGRASHFCSEAYRQQFKATADQLLRATA
jgi:YHS domain-containing protein